MGRKNLGALHRYDPQDLLDDEFDIDEFVDAMGAFDYRRRSRHAANARRRIEEAREARWLREQIDDSYDET